MQPGSCTSNRATWTPCGPAAKPAFASGHAEAVADLTALLKFSPEDAYLYEQLARCYDALNDRSGADADRKKAVEVCAKRPTAAQ